MLTSHLRAVADAIPLIAFRAAAGGTPLLIGLFIAGRWGLEDLAAFTVAYAMIAVATVVVDWGATRALPRNLATLPPAPAAHFLASSTSLRLLLAAAVLAAGSLAALAGWLDPQVARFLAVLFPLCPAMVITTNAISERVVSAAVRPIGTAVAAGVGVFAALGGTSLALGLGPLWFVAAYVAGKLVEAVVLAAGRWWVMSLAATGLPATAALLWPFGAQMILGVIYSRLAVFTVERFTTRAELGVFSVAVALHGALLLVPTSLALLHFPDLTRRTRAGDAPGVRRLLVRYTIVSGLGVFLGVATLALLMTPVSELLQVPRSLAPLVVAFAALAALTIFSTMAGFLLQARGLESIAARWSVVTLLLGLLYQVAALSAFGLWGIVLGAAAGELTTILIFGAAIRRRPAAGHGAAPA